MTKIQVEQGQTIFDIALQYYGSLEGLSYLIEDNDFDGEMVFGNPPEDLELDIREDSAIDQSIVEYHSNKVLTTF
jgi:hypothetical protein